MNPPRILVVDDEQHIVQVLSLSLRKAGYDVETAADGDAAWHAIENRRPDLLITDQVMPGITGLELAQRIHNTDDKPLPVLIITARQPNLNTDGIDNIAAILPKPFSPRQVLAQVSQQVGPAHATQEIKP